MRTHKNNRWVPAAALVLSLSSGLSASAAQIAEERTGEQRMSELSPQAALCSASSLRLLKSVDSSLEESPKSGDERSRSRTAGRDSADSSSAL